MREDPANWSAASVDADLSHLDSFRDELREIAADELKKINVPVAPRVLQVIVAVAERGIQAAVKKGLIHNDDSATFTPKFLELLSRIISEIIYAPNSKLHAQCLDFVFQLGIQMGISQSSIARQHQPMTRANVSKICIGICQRYSIPPSRGMKSLAARKNYSLRQQGRRAKSMREEWPLADVLKKAVYGINAT